MNWNPWCKLMNHNFSLLCICYIGYFVTFPSQCYWLVYATPSAQCSPICLVCFNSSSIKSIKSTWFDMNIFAYAIFINCFPSSLLLFLASKLGVQLNVLAIFMVFFFLHLYWQGIQSEIDFYLKYKTTTFWGVGKRG